MPRRKITPQQQDDYHATYIPPPWKIRLECAAIRKARPRKKTGHRRKDEPGEIREYGHRDLGLDEPFTIED